LAQVRKRPLCSVLCSLVRLAGAHITLPMMRVGALLLLLAGASATQVTPIQKVIQMLTDMAAKGVQEKQDEEVRFASYKGFCEHTSKDRRSSINSAKESLVQLAADIQKAEADSMTASKGIAAHDADIQTWEADKAEASAVRKTAHADFEEVHKDYSDALDAVDRAVNVLKSGPGHRQFMQTSLVQLSSLDRVPAKAKNLIMAFLQRDAPESALMQDAEALEAGYPAAPEARGFESSSGGIIDMVQKLGEKFEDERSELEKKESNDRHSFDMMAQELTDQVEAGNRERNVKISSKAQNEQDKSSAQGEQSETSATLAEDEKFLGDLTAECEQKAADFEKRQELRQGELDAIDKAVEIMGSDSVSGSGNKHLPGLIQATSFAQLRSSSTSPVQQVVASFLADKAKSTNSRVLSLISMKVSEDPFKKVTKMIKDMIIKLMEEANEEAEHKGFCDTELTTNKQTRDSKTEQAAELTAEIEKLTADIAKLGTEIAELGEAIASIDAAVAEATSLRSAEREKNEATIADAKAGQAAVAQATQVLKDFYAKAAQATALAQMGVPGSPETFDKPYTGMAGGGVLGMLEVCESDFARLDADTTSGEAQSQKAFEEFTSDSAEDKAVKAANMKHKEGSKQGKESALGKAKKDLAGTQEELSAAMAYYEKLKPSCVDAGESYEERVARRKEEIESLQEALKILSGDSV